MTALLDTWADEVGEDAAQGILFACLLARADPALAEIGERGIEESDEDTAFGNQAAREQWCAALKDWLQEQGVGV